MDWMVSFIAENPVVAIIILAFLAGGLFLRGK